MEELTQSQQFTIWYERICRDRAYAATWLDLAGRVGKDREMLDWLSEHLYQVWRTEPGSGYLLLEYMEEGETGLVRRTVYGKGLRDVVRKAMREEK